MKSWLDVSLYVNLTDFPVLNCCNIYTNCASFQTVIEKVNELYVLLAPKQVPWTYSLLSLFPRLQDSTYELRPSFTSTKTTSMPAPTRHLMCTCGSGIHQAGRGRDCARN